MLLLLSFVVAVCCLASKQRASVSQGPICADHCTCCHTETEVADQNFCLTQSQYTDTGPTGPKTDPVSPCAWQGSHWSANFEVTDVTRPGKIPMAQVGIETRIYRSRGGRLNHSVRYDRKDEMYDPGAGSLQGQVFQGGCRLTTRPARRYILGRDLYQFGSNPERFNRQV